MALKLTHYYRLQRSVVDYDAVIGHLESVLKNFLMKPDCTRFYIGITKDLEARRMQHERMKPEFTLMCVIYGEDANIVEVGFDDLEARAIAKFRAGVRNPTTGKVLRCENSTTGSTAKRWLYLLVDKQNVAEVPFKRPGDLWATAL